MTSKSPLVPSEFIASAKRPVTKSYNVQQIDQRICTAPEGEFDFLGYTFGRMFSARTGQARTAIRPDMTGICAFETFEPTSQIDVKRSCPVRLAS